jgi:vacuolar-type H+-ATPase subunit E/Vma4
MGPKNMTTPIKPPEISTMNQDEIGEIYRQMEMKIIENREQMMEEIENKMNRKMEDMTSKMDENMQKLHNSLSSLICQTLDERPPKGDIKMP